MIETAWKMINMTTKEDIAPAERPTRFNKQELMHEIEIVGSKVTVLIKMAVNEAKFGSIDVLDTFEFDRASRMFEILGFPQEMVIDCLRETYHL
jgi:hypothetical protein